MANPPSEPESKRSPLKIDEALIDGSVVYENLGQDIILTTEDKLWRCLRENEDSLRGKRGWVAPFGILLTLITSLLALTFDKDFLGIKGNTWHATFIVGSVVVAVWLVIAITAAIKQSRKAGIMHVIKEIKADSRRADGDPPNAGMKQVPK